MLSLKLIYTIWFHGNYFLSCLQLPLPWGIPGSQQCCHEAHALWPLWPRGTCSHGAPGVFPPDSQGCSGHAWMMFQAEHGAWLFIGNSDFELLMTLNLLLTAVSLYVSVGLVSKIKIQSRLDDFISLHNITTSLSVNSGFPQQSHELWPVFYAWFSLLSWIPLASKTCKTGSAALKQRFTSLWVWVFGSHLFQKNVSILHRMLSPWIFLISCFVLAQV